MNVDDLIDHVEDTATITPEEAHMMGTLAQAALQSEGTDSELVAVIPPHLLHACAIVMSTGLETLRKEGRIAL